MEEAKTAMLNATVEANLELVSEDFLVTKGTGPFLPLVTLSSRAMESLIWPSASVTMAQVSATGAPRSAWRQRAP